MSDTCINLYRFMQRMEEVKGSRVSIGKFAILELVEKAPASAAGLYPTLGITHSAACISMSELENMGFLIRAGYGKPFSLTAKGQMALDAFRRAVSMEVIYEPNRKKKDLWGAKRGRAPARKMQPVPLSGEPEVDGTAPCLRETGE